jgi:hypothetical protein
MHSIQADAIVTTNLTLFRKQLGVNYQIGDVRFDDTAPLAAICKAVMMSAINSPGLLRPL